MSPKFKSFVEKVKCGEIDETQLDPEVVKQIHNFLSTRSSMEETVSGYLVLDWMKNNKMLGEKKEAYQELKAFTAKQTRGRAIERRTTSKSLS